MRRAATSSALEDRAKVLASVPAAAAAAFADAKPTLIKAVDRAIFSHPEVQRFLGGNSPDLLKTNHVNHASFMLEVMRVNQFDLLARTLPWVYRAYHNQGVDFDYFPVELNAWMDAIQNTLAPALAAPILEIYRWMLAQHSLLVESPDEDEDPPADDDDWKALRTDFGIALGHADHRRCLELCRNAVSDGRGLPELFHHLIFPVMVEVGLRWERGEVTVAGEHQATAIVNKVLAALYFDADLPKTTVGTALVTASPGERHEIGAWMMATCLEIDGWDVVYLGADTPVEDIMTTATRQHVDLVAISVAMPFNMEPLRTVIARLRAHSETRHTRILVGGGLFLRFPFLAQDLDADACIGDCIAAVKWARQILTAPAHA